MLKKNNITFLIVIIITVISCDVFNKQPEGEVVARVNDSYLYKSDIEALVTEGITPEDSTVRINNYINQWATQQLLMDGAVLNLSEDKQQEFNELVDQYKNDLFTKAYIEALVKQHIDTTITEAQVAEVYENNKETFKLNEELIKFRYINVAESNADIDDIRERFKRFDADDKKLLDSIAIQFKSYSLNDSIWIKVNQAVLKIPVINAENKDELLKKSNFIQLKDSLDLYLMQIKDVLVRNDIAPIEYVMPTIKQIVINKRKLEYIKKLETDITKDAIKNKQFEIYN